MENSEAVKQPKCPACGRKDQDKLLLPYCSVFCRVLGTRGLGWRTNPCRIVDLETRVILTQGRQFDLSGPGLSDLVVRANAIRRTHRLKQLREAAELEQIKRSAGGSFSIPGPENRPAA